MDKDYYELNYLGNHRWKDIKFNTEVVWHKRCIRPGCRLLVSWSNILYKWVKQEI